MRIVRITDLRRRRQRSAAELDAALERALELRDPGGDFETELRAAEALASAFEPVSAPAEALVALRAAIAARKAALARRKARLAWRVAPGAAAAMATGLLAFIGIGGLHTGNGGTPGFQDADQALRAITERMTEVQNVVSARDVPAAAAQAQLARDALVQAQGTAVALPVSDPARDLLLNTAVQKIAELEALLARLHLPPVPPLPPVPGGKATSVGAQASTAPSSTTSSSSSTSTSSTTSSTSTSTSTTSTTSTTQAATVLPTRTGHGGSTTTSSSTTTSTTAPPPPTTTSTSAPPAP